ncbi:uncharacterized protein [Pleurodeles waltl]|uniref:uncharacterized protein n=1 Tax=Pleurodeles waltl TaxID=8319 RepID=UPI003709933D
MPSAFSNHNLPVLSRWEPRCLKGPPCIPGLLRAGSVAVERKTADREKTECKDDGESRAVSSGYSSRTEETAPSAGYCQEKPVVPSRDEGDNLRKAGREWQPRFRRSVADAGDSAYSLRPWILTPYPTPGNLNERRYNIAHQRTRAVIERTFGLLKSRFRYLHKSGGALQYAPETACKIVATCAILHNIATRQGLYLTPNDTDLENKEQELPHQQPGDRSIAMEGRQRRNYIATHYFCSRCLCNKDASSPNKSSSATSSLRTDCIVLCRLRTEPDDPCG